ncbi:MAG: hypothetical protein RIQ51_533 [Bacteroidota bacterium]|jgi:hypothetical protein
MKKSTGFVGIFFLSFIFLTACSKKDQQGPLTDPPEQNLPAPLSAPLFDELNETIVRFDPLYLQIVYKDKRTKAEINDEATRLLIAINENPNSLEIQKELTELYHFKNFADLQKASNIISTNSGELKKTFLGKDTVLSKVKMNQLNVARNTFLKNKIISLEKASQKRSSGLWQDNADWILNEFHYYSQVANLEIDLGLEGGGTGAGPGAAECNELCCYEFQSCKVNANNNFLVNIFKFGGAGGTALSLTAGAIGSIVPVFGTAIGLITGGIVGGINGAILANVYHNNELQICFFNYKACLEKKKEN